ncbi:MAG: ribonuclease HII [Saprospiraceae bacterium]
MLLPFLEANCIEAGCDEAGRGCLAGPVFAAAVILPADFFHKDLNDSKQMAEKQREKLRCIIEQEAIAWAVGTVSALEIDSINILNASFLAMHRSLEQLSLVPQSLLIDGNRFKKYKDIPHHCIIKGDGKFYAIAAASVLAKTYRDEYMLQIHEKFPAYNWKQNKGYPTKSHRKAIEALGATVHHRMSFKLLAENKQTQLF